MVWWRIHWPCEWRWRIWDCHRLQSWVKEEENCAEIDETSFPFCPWLQPQTLDAVEEPYNSAAFGSKTESVSPSEHRRGRVNSREKHQRAIPTSIDHCRRDDSQWLFLIHMNFLLLFLFCLLIEKKNSCSCDERRPYTWQKETHITY